MKLKRFSAITNKIDGSIARLLVALVVIIGFGAIIRPELFLTHQNFESIARQLPVFSLLALGVGICMIAGGIDLSTVYIANLTSISLALFMQQFETTTATGELGLTVIAIVLGIVIGILCGVFNGFLVSKMKIPPMLATLGTQQFYLGIGIVISGGSTISGVPGVFAQIDTMVFGLVPLPFIIFIMAAIVLTFVMKRTKLGERIYFVGTNEKSSKFAGIKVNITLIKAYAMSGVLASIAGIISLATLRTANASFGASFIMISILVVVLGGINPNGGFGNILGIALGAIVLQVLSSLLNMFPEISNFYRDLIWGATLIAVLIINVAIDKERYKKAMKKVVSEAIPKRNKQEDGN